MKKLAGLVIILAALVLGGYYGMGVLTEKTIRKNIKTIDQSNGLSAEIEQYKRGLFTSEAKINWKLHIPEHVVKDANGQAQTVPAQDFSTDMPLIIYHGPIIFANHKVLFGLGYAETVFPFPQKYVDQFDQTFTKESTKPELDLSIFVNYLNQSTLDMKVPPFDLFAKEGNSHMQWMGLDAKTTISSGMKKVGGDVSVEGIRFTKDDTNVDLGKVNTDYDLHLTASGLYLGQANFNLPTFTVTVKDQKIFQVSDIVVKSDSNINDHLFDTTFSLTLKSIYANDKSYGPGDFALAVRNLDADVLARINQQAAAMQNGTDIERQQAMLALLPDLPKLFSKGAEFEISKFNLKIPQGEVDGNLLISFPKSESNNPLELMQKVHGNARLKVPAAALKELMQRSLMQQMAREPELQQKLMQQLQNNQATPATTPQPALTPEQIAAMQADKQLNALQQSGLVTVQGSDYLIEVTLDQGKFTINGKPYDSSMLKF